MKSRACKPPALGRGATPTATALQQPLPLESPASRLPPESPASHRPPESPASRLPQVPAAEKLWFCLWLPQLALEAVRSPTSGLPQAVVEEQHGVHRILLADDAARAAGILPGQATNAALALLPTLQLEERSALHEQRALERLAGWLEHFSSFVSIAGSDTLLLEIAGSLRLFGGLRELRRKLSHGLRELGFTASLAIAPTPLAATWLARSGQRVCVRGTANLAPVVRRLSLACLDWPPALCEALAGMGVTTVGDCLRLPRAGFARRFGAQYLLSLIHI